MNPTQWVLLLAGLGALIATAFMLTLEAGIFACGIFAILGAFLAGE